MKLNCRKGDLAIGVKAIPSKAHNIGLLVECLRLIGPARWEVRVLAGYFVDGVYRKAGTIAAAGDACLRPLRDSDGTDETLSWIDVPNEVTA